MLRKGRTQIDRLNYKALQFFDMLSGWLTDDEIRENKDLLYRYISKNLTKNDFLKNIQFYSTRVTKIIVEEGLINAFRQ